MRVIFFGMQGEFSLRHLAALLDAGLDVRGVVVPAPPDPAAPSIREWPPAEPLPAAHATGECREPTPLDVAQDRGIPVFAVRRLEHPDTLAALSALEPDAACVACFPQRIPRSLLALPRFGCLNVHPSLLPDYRGPEPLFWQLRDGVSTTGVTIHFMDDDLDTGDIACQASVELGDGLSGTEINRLCAERGGRLLVDALAALGRGELERRPQPAGGARLPAPRPADFVLDTAWPARRAFNFMRGTAEWGMPYRVEAGGATVSLRQALSYSATHALEQPIIDLAGEVWLRFSPGVLRARKA